MRSVNHWMNFFGLKRRVNHLQKIKDERLVLKNLQNIRVLYLVQTLGIIGILAYDLITKGFDGMTSNPLWYVFIITTIVGGYLSMSISVDHEVPEKKPGPYYRGVIITGLIGVGFGLLTGLPNEGTLTVGIIVGIVVFICSLVPYSYIYYLRKKRFEENDA